MFNSISRERMIQCYDREILLLMLISLFQPLSFGSEKNLELITCTKILNLFFAMALYYQKEKPIY